MKKFYIVLLLFLLFLNGCSDQNEENIKKVKSSKTEIEKVLVENTPSPTLVSKEEEQKQTEPTKSTEPTKLEMDYGKIFKVSPSGNYVAFYEPQIGFSIHDKQKDSVTSVSNGKIVTFSWSGDILYYLIEDTKVNDYFSMNQLFAYEIDKQKSFIVIPAEVNQEEGYLKDTYFFDINPDGDVLVSERVGIIDSEYWLNYYIADSTFGKIGNILTDYEYISNHLTWSGSKIPFITQLEDDPEKFVLYIYEDDKLEKISSDILQYLGEDISMLDTIEVSDDNKVFTFNFYNSENNIIKRQVLRKTGNIMVEE